MCEFQPASAKGDKVGKNPMISAGFSKRIFLISLMTGLLLGQGCGDRGDKPAEKGSADYMIKQGDNIKVEYKGMLDDGTVFDQSRQEAPLQFVVGTGQLIRGFDEGVLGMKLNEEKTLTIPPEEAYGMPDPALVRSFPKDFFQEDMQVEIGQRLQLRDQSGRPHACTVAEIAEDSVSLDFNNPLAGKTLTFEIKVVDIQ